MNERKLQPVTNDTPADWPRFQQGERIAVKGVWFRLERIEPGGIWMVPEGQMSTRRYRRARAAERGEPGAG